MSEVENVGSRFLSLHQEEKIILESNGTGSVSWGMSPRNHRTLTGTWSPALGRGE